MTAEGTRTSKVMPLEAVPDHVPDGCSIFVGGFTIHRVPMGMVREIARARRRQLTVWSHIGGAPIEMLLAVGAVACVRSSYVGLDVVGLAPLYSSLTATGEVDFVEETEATIMFGMKATIYRIPFMPARALVGSQLVEVRPDLQEYVCQISGERLVAIPPVRADIGLIHAQRADVHGNVEIRGTMGNDVEIAKVCDRVIVSVEEVVDPSTLDPDVAQLPGHLVDGIVELPMGAYPTACLPFYETDFGYFFEYVKRARAGDLDPYREAHIDGLPFPEYVQHVATW